MGNKIKFKRGSKSKLPKRLDYGEPAFVSDEGELYIGTQSGNVKLTSKSEIENINGQLADINKNKYILKENDNLIDKLKTYDVIEIPPKMEISLSEPLIISNKSLYSTGRGENKAKIIFNLNHNNEDCLTCFGSFYLSGIEFDFDYTGNDGLTVIHSDRGIINDIILSKSYRSSFCVKDTNEYSWTENLQVDNLLIQGAGEHGFSFVKKLTFMNECSFKNVEIRGISQKTFGGIFIYCNSSSSNATAKLSCITFENANFDAQRSVSIANGYDIGVNMLLFDCDISKKAIYECISIKTGGWESINGEPKFDGNTVQAMTNADVRLFEFRNIVTYNWTNGQVDVGTTEWFGNTTTSNKGFNIPSLEKLNVRNKMYDDGEFLINNGFTLLKTKCYPNDNSQITLELPFKYSKIDNNLYRGYLFEGEISFLNAQWGNDLNKYKKYAFTILKNSSYGGVNNFKKYPLLNNETIFVELDEISFNNDKLLVKFTPTNINNNGGAVNTINIAIRISGNLF